jgi:hypothetical protein
MWLQSQWTPGDILPGWCGQTTLCEAVFTSDLLIHMSFGGFAEAYSLFLAFTMEFCSTVLLSHEWYTDAHVVVKDAGIVCNVALMNNLALLGIAMRR